MRSHEKSQNGGGWKGPIEIIWKSLLPYQYGTDNLLGHDLDALYTQNWKNQPLLKLMYAGMDNQQVICKSFLIQQ